MIKKKLIMIMCCLVLGVNIISSCSDTEKSNTEVQSTETINTEIENKEDEVKQVEPKQIETNKKDEMIADIESSIVRGMVKVTSQEAKNKIGANYIEFKNIPQRFKEYGIYINNESYDPMVKHIWYDPDKFELIDVTQIKQSNPEKDHEEAEMIFSGTAEDGKPISGYHPWAEYRSSWGFTKKGVFVYGFMLVNDSNNIQEYKNILKSLKQ